MTWMAAKAWTGRDDGPGPEHARWHNTVQPWSAQAPAGTMLLGLASDEGVRRNQGRVGAAKGPEALRQALASLALQTPLKLYDAGDVQVADGDLEAAQAEFGRRLADGLRDGHFTVGLGGGHEIAYASFLGIQQALGEGKSWRLGVLNIDPHFDLRKAPNATSGTGFLQIAQAQAKAGRPFHYAVVGASETSNTRALFERARDLGVRVLMDDDCRLDQLTTVRRFVQDFIACVDHVYLTIDLDVLPASVAPGVSAPAALGTAPEVVQAVAEQVARSGKLLHADVAELCPRLDVDSRTARTAARLIHRIVTNRELTS